ncbi:radical SAM protein [Candidatus Gracilibacteria bacterium]|nr:radical SAM protein [Candidatus Gracilibacteria bacterium]
MEYKVFGCKVNKYYTDKWLNSEKLKDENGIFIASCVVTDNAKRKWIKFVKDSFKDFSSEKKMFISGCGAFKDGRAQEDFFELYPELDQFKGRIIILGEDPNEVDTEIAAEKTQTVKQKQISKAKIQNISSQFSGIYTKKFILIQGGCDSFCTFCLTVIKRGRHFSRSKEDILEEVVEFGKTGGKEVVLTGINLSAWGLDTTNDIGKSRLAELLNYLLDNSTIPRIRISSMGPEFIDDECFKVFAKTRIYPHFHYSVQSGSTSVLKGMKRHYTGEYMRETLKKTLAIKREDGVSIGIGADIIVGFPGESEQDYNDTLELVKNYGITKLHAFPFSGHDMGESVPAGDMGNQVDGKIKKQRMQTLLATGEETRAAFVEMQKGKELAVLIEVVKKDGENITWKGWTQNYVEADENSFEIFSGKVKKNEIVIGTLL